MLRANDCRSAALPHARSGDLETNLSKVIDLGNTDAKMVGRADVLAMRLEAVSGPTHDDQPPFAWTAKTDGLAPHYGQPALFNFSWTVFSAAH